MGVIDMPSFDSRLMTELRKDGALVIIAEQNNGFIYKMAREFLFGKEGTGRVVPINALDADGERRFIHSATYDQLLDDFGLSPAGIARTIRRELGR